MRKLLNKLIITSNEDLLDLIKVGDIVCEWGDIEYQELKILGIEGNTVTAEVINIGCCFSCISESELIGQVVFFRFDTDIHRYTVNGKEYLTDYYLLCDGIYWNEDKKCYEKSDGYTFEDYEYR